MNLAMLLVATLVSQTADDRLVVSPGSRLVAREVFNDNADAIDFGSTRLQLEPFTWTAWVKRPGSEYEYNFTTDSVHPYRRWTDDIHRSSSDGTFAFIQNKYSSTDGEIYTVVAVHDAMEFEGTTTYSIELTCPAGFTYWLIPKVSGQGFVSRRDVLTKFRVFPPARLRDKPVANPTTTRSGGY